MASGFLSLLNPDASFALGVPFWCFASSGGRVARRLSRRAAHVSLPEVSTPMVSSSARNSAFVI
eukprot:8150346-Pyramimonas_sp.AAC.1